MKRIYDTDCTFENGNVYVNGELYGTELEFWTDRDRGKFEYIATGHDVFGKENEEADNDDDNAALTVLAAEALLDAIDDSPSTDYDNGSSSDSGSSSDLDFGGGSSDGGGAGSDW